MSSTPETTTHDTYAVDVTCRECGYTAHIATPTWQVAEHQELAAREHHGRTSHIVAVVSTRTTITARTHGRAPR